MSVPPSIREKYIVDIGIECHVQLATRTKLFAGVVSGDFDAEPNTNISPICLGMPGALPYLNEHAVDLAIRAGLALNAKIANFSKFDRKNYFYPDLPKGYQITQFDEPIIIGGYIEAFVDDKLIKFDITRAHLEEDAGKTTHPAGKDYSLVDLNRAGSPLLEIVSEPCMHSSAEAKAYARELHAIVRYAGVSDADLYHGNMRFDVNVSVRLKDSKTLGTRTETKNLNSFRSIERAVEYEVERQIEIIETGDMIVQETRGWNDAKQKTFSQRSKEEAHDYRYFPEPDLPPVVVTQEMIDTAKTHLGKLPSEIRKLLDEAGVKTEDIETLLVYPELINILLDSIGKDKLSNQRIANWLGGEIVRTVSIDGYDWGDFLLMSQDMNDLSDMVSDGSLSSSAAKQVLEQLVSTDKSAQEIAVQLDILQESDAGALDEMVRIVIEQNEKAAQDVRAGEMRAIGFLVGQVMKLSQGKANPQKIREILQKTLS